MILILYFYMGSSDTGHIITLDSRVYTAMLPLPLVSEAISFIQYTSNPLSWLGYWHPGPVTTIFGKSCFYTRLFGMTCRYYKTTHKARPFGWSTQITKIQPIGISWQPTLLQSRSDLFGLGWLRKIDANTVAPSSWAFLETARKFKSAATSPRKKNVLIGTTVIAIDMSYFKDRIPVLLVFSRERSFLIVHELWKIMK